MKQISEVLEVKMHGDGEMMHGIWTILPREKEKVDTKVGIKVGTKEEERVTKETEKADTKVDTKEGSKGRKVVPKVEERIRYHQWV